VIAISVVVFALAVAFAVLVSAWAGGE